MADLNYYESGYIDAGFFVYTADAASAISSSASMTCDAGKVVSAESSLASEFTQTTYASRTKDIDLNAFNEALIAVQISVIRTTNIAATAVFDISTDGRRFRDIASAEDAVFNIDVVNERSRATSMETQAAFSITADGDVIGAALEGAADLTTTVDLSATISKTTIAQASLDSLSDLSAEILKTSDTQASLDCHVDLSVVISHIHGADIIASGFAELSTTVTVTRSADAALDCITDQNVICSRTRNYDSAASAVCEITAACGILKVTDCTASSTVDLTAGVSVIVDFTSAVAASTNLSAVNDRLRNSAVDCSALADVSCVISHIHGADLTAFSNASLTVDSEVNKTVAASLASEVAVSITASKATISSAAMQSYFSVFTSKYFGYGRPWNVTYTQGPSSHQYGPIVSIDNNYSAIPKQGQDWVFDISFFINDTTSPYTTWGTNRSTFNLGPLSNSGTTLSLIKSDGTTVSRSDISRPSISDQTLRITVLKQGSNIQLFENGVNRGNLTSSGDFTWYSPATFKFNWAGQTLGGNNVSLEYVYFSIGNIYGLSTGAGTISNLARTNEVPTTRLNLKPVGSTGNSVFVDDLRILNQQGIAALTATSTITASLGGPQRAAADLSAVFTQSANISVDRSADLTAFSDAAVTATVDRIRSGDAALELLADLSSSADRIRDISETLTATSLLVNDVSVTRETSVNTDAVFSELVAVAKIGDFLVSADVISELAVQAVKTTETSATLAFDVAANIQAEKIVDAVCFMEPIGFLTLNDISVIRTTSATLTSNSEQNTVGEKLAGLVGDLQSEFNLTATASGTIDAIALVMSSGTLAITVERQRPGSAALDSTFTQTTETYDSLAKQGTAALETIITTTSDIHRIRDVEIATDAVASELVAIGKIGQGFITCESYATVNAQVVKITDQDLTITAVSTVAVIADKLHSTAVAVLDVNAALLAEGTTNITVEADLTALANISADARRSRGFNSTITANSNLVCDTGRIRPFAELVVAAATLTVDTTRIRSASSHFDAIASELVLGDAITGGSATLSAAFTLTAQGRDIDLTKYVYTIGSETRFHKIQSENRTRKIREETRIYKIRRV